MFADRQVFCFIAARGGSKGLPRKNVLMLAGKPLISHTIELAKKIKYIDKIFVSTEDSEIKKISSQNGAIVIDRPVELATDTALHLDVVKHFIESNKEILENNPIIVMMNATSPIRRKEDVEKCIESYDKDTNILVSISEVKIHPSRMFVKKGDFLQFYLNSPPISNRQEVETLYAMNGSVFISDCDFIRKQKNHILGGKIKGYLMDEKYSMDIDTNFDFEICKLIIESKI